MRVGAADVPVRRLIRSQCVYVTVGTTRTAMKEIVLMTTFPLYSTHGDVLESTRGIKRKYTFVTIFRLYSVVWVVGCCCSWRGGVPVVVV